MRQDTKPDQLDGTARHVEAPLAGSGLLVKWKHCEPECTAVLL